MSGETQTTPPGAMEAAIAAFLFEIAVPIGKTAGLSFADEELDA